MGTSWGNHGEIMGKSWGNHGEIMRTCMINICNEFFVTDSDSPDINSWRNGGNHLETELHIHPIVDILITGIIMNNIFSNGLMTIPQHGYHSLAHACPCMPMAHNTCVSAQLISTHSGLRSSLLIFSKASQRGKSSQESPEMEGSTAQGVSKEYIIQNHS